MIRSFIYDTFILRLTSGWYAEILKRVPEEVLLLDVGIGTAGALLSNADLVRQKRIRITGIDVDADYIESARRKLRDSPLKDHARVSLESVYDHQGGPYDAIYFSGSLMLLSRPEAALQHCCTLLRPHGRIYLTHTLELHSARWMEVLKPRLRWLTSIEFGSVTYEEPFKQQIRAAGLELEEFTILAHHGNRASCIAVARRANANP